LAKALSETDYDVLILDLFTDEGLPLTPDGLQRLKRKKNGAKCLVVAYMSIGEDEDYRHYWKKYWGVFKPKWLDDENPNWKGNYKVKFWIPGWQKLIMGTKDSYLDMVLLAGFDGVYLDILDAYLYYRVPLISLLVRCNLSLYS
jgi:cysteinyl-tRNA synthetase